MEKSIEELIYDETEIRLNKMESEDYVFPKRANKVDAVVIIGGILICVALIVLCMVGVIE